MYPDRVPISQNEIEESYGVLFNKSRVLNGRFLLEELSGGLTNRNFKVETPSGKYVARISSNESSFLAIDRESEFQNSKIAAQAGIGAPVHDYLPGEGMLVIQYLEGFTYNSELVAANLDRIASACRTLHGASPFTREFNMFQVQQEYLTIVLEHGFKIPSDYQSLATEVKHLKRVLAVNAQPLVPCNNDLLPGNFIDDGNKIWLIDYEYSGNNDRCFELGNIWSEAVLDIDALEELVNHYFQKESPEQFARAWLFAVMAKYGWTLWASIQDAISTIDFDFWSWGMEKYEDCKELFSSPRYQRMLEMALGQHI